MTQWIRSFVSLLSVCTLLFVGTAGTFAQDSARDDSAPASGPSAVTLDASYRAPASTEGGNLLYDNGPLVNNPGGGVGGADESVLQNTSLLMTTYGFGHQVSLTYRVADDFTVTDDDWTIDSLVFWGYQTNSTTTSTFTEVRYQIWDGPPNDGGSTILFGDLTTNRMIGTTWSNIYRVDEPGSGTVTNRPIMKNTASGGITLTAGTYWIEWMSNGTLGSGPWAPPVTINGQTTTGNGLQWVGSWQSANDAGTLTPQALPFLLYGTATVSTTPIISVSPLSISETLAPNDSIDVTVTVSNIGTADLDWAAAITSSAIQGRTETGRQVVLTTNPTLISQAGQSLAGQVGTQTNPPTEGGVSLIIDDGTQENNIGLTAGGQFIWLNRFTPAGSDFPFTLNEVQVLFDAGIGVDVGEVVDIYIYEDTDGDGNPGTGAVNLGSIVGATVQANDGFTWSVYSTSVQLNGPGDVLIAVVNRTAGIGAGEFPAAVDQTATQARSWVGTYTAGNPPNPPPLPATSLWGEIGTFGLPGNWLVRGAGTAGGGGGMLEWISLIGTTSGTVTPANSATFDVRLRGVASSTGGDTTYTGTIEITSNDPATPSILIDVTLMVSASNQEPLMSLTHTPGNLNMGIFNDGSIGADQVGQTGPGITWNGLNGCFVGGPIFGTTSVGAVNGLIGSFMIFGDLVNVSSNFAGGFTSDGDFDQIASADLDDSGAAAPYGVKILQRSYTNTGEEAGFIRYGYVNNSGNDLTDFYSGIFVDWDVDDYLTNSGGYDLDRNLIYTFDAVGANPYFGLIALDGLSGGRTTTDTPPGSVQAGSFEYITTTDLTILANGDFRTWIGAGPSNVDPGDTTWASYAVVAGDDLAGLLANADAAIAKAIAVGWIGTTGVDEPLTEVPVEFGLTQNYPNPFNPTTRITYALPQEASVTLKVYNVLGQEVITLENSVQQAGFHEVNWNAKNTLGQSVGSGVYFYRLEAKGTSGETFTNLKKMLFLK